MTSNSIEAGVDSATYFARIGLPTPCTFIYCHLGFGDCFFVPTLLGIVKIHLEMWALVPA
jgi:hypothetical protein